MVDANTFRFIEMTIFFLKLVTQPLKFSLISNSSKSITNNESRVFRSQKYFTRMSKMREKLASST